MDESPRLSMLGWRFLQIGLTGFGGALANTALMEHEWVGKRHLVTQEQFFEDMACCYLLPGPTAVLLSISLGSRLRGIRGGIISGMAFLAPAVLLTLLFSWAYFQYHALPAVLLIFQNVGTIAVALIVALLSRSSQTVLTSRSRWGLSIAVGILLICPFLPQAWNLLTLLFLSGLVGILCFRERLPVIGGTGMITLSGALAFARDVALSPSMIVLVPLALGFFSVSLGKRILV